MGAEVAFLLVVFGRVAAAFFADAAFVDPVGALAMVFLAGAVFFTAPFALLVVLEVVRFVAEVFVVLGAALALPPLAVPGLAALFVAALVALVLAELAPAGAFAVRALAVPDLAGLDFVLPLPLDAALFAPDLAVVTLFVAVAAPATLRLRRGWAASVESVARTLVVIPSPSKRFRETGSAATLRVDRAVLAAVASPRNRPGDLAGPASLHRAARSSWSAMSWPALPVLLARWSIHGAGKSTSRP